MSEVKQQTQHLKVKGVVDLVFCFDCTGSMQNCIDKVKNNVQAFVDELKNQSQMVPDWRVRAMGYRDFNSDTEQVINHFPFVNDVASFQNQLSQLVAEGGGDNPESTFDALWYALKETEWRETGKCHKVIVLFTDDDTHPVHQDTIDRFGITDATLTYLLQELALNKIKVFLFGKSCDNYEQFNLLPKASIKLFPEPNKEFDNADFKELLETIAKTVSSEAAALQPL